MTFYQYNLYHPLLDKNNEKHDSEYFADFYYGLSRLFLALNEIKICKLFIKRSIDYMLILVKDKNLEKEYLKRLTIAYRDFGWYRFSTDNFYKAHVSYEKALETALKIHDSESEIVAFL